ncbi:hypothetical protein JKP75_05770 [Blastococcus sp. TML/M2B]|uniref:hypothetical protein n=1 Tax=Blastococcus sp. TML/M2B TaxID=2798727 RepID=UPI00190991E9|nr:hypothetical protein [Blastococcus sp. TML/M2B]MBN1092114.1 hypothetical protein [Blastococcus sp. TML/M2B]
MLEPGKAGTLGAGKGVVPVLSDGVVVAALRASSWKEQATAVVGGREWVFSKREGELRGRWADDPEDAVRLRARQTSFWKGTWSAELDGVPVEVSSLSYWKGTHRFVSGGRQVAHSGSTGGWSPRPTLTADPAMSLEHQVFLLFLERVIMRRNATAVVAATAGAAVAGGAS